MQPPFSENLRIKKGGFLDKNNSIRDSKFCVDDRCLFQEALYLGYLDTCRTIHPRNESKKTFNEKVKSLFKEEKGIAYYLQDFFKRKHIEKAEAFDELHHKWCNFLIEQFKNKTGEPLKYGQAQKIINMAFKYLCCCVKIDIFQDYFKFCHMPLDSVILEWIWRNRGKAEFSEMKINKSSIGPWSSINWSDDDKNDLDDEGQYTYMFYVRTIRRIIGDEKNPLEAEFSIWEDMQKELACEAFFFSLENKDQKEKEGFKSKALDEKMRVIISLLKQYIKGDEAK